MEHYAGIDVSLESASVCVVDGTGRIVREAKVPSEPEALATWLVGLDVELARVGLEAGPLSQWLYAGLRQAGLPVELLETRHVRDAFKAMPVKTDRKDARGIAQLLRLGWFRPVHCRGNTAGRSTYRDGNGVRGSGTTSGRGLSQLRTGPDLQRAARSMRDVQSDLRVFAPSGRALIEAGDCGADLGEAVATKIGWSRFEAAVARGNSQRTRTDRSDG
ncbi:MAG: transposase [Acetobacteraceae bacterium]|nr:transposase [Acetobacteraceae bacterium]